MGGRRCERPGCRAWARRDGRLCAAHVGRRGTDGATRAGLEEQETPLAGPVEGRPSARLAAVIDRLEAGQEAGLAGEIAAARLTLARLLRESDDPLRLADGLAKTVGVILKAWQLEHEHEADGESLEGLSARVLDEIGLPRGGG